jgi:hypothetical protein
MGKALQRIIQNVLPWKKKYGSIYYVKIDEREYVFRVLSRGEYLSLLIIQDKFKIDIGDLILKECLVYPKFNKSTFDKRKAGEIDGLIACISDKSGFSKTDQILQDLEGSRAKIGTLDSQIIVLICKAFPHLTLQEINNLTYEDMIQYVSVSEEILGAKLNIEKPKPSKPGTIDFDEENKVMGATPFVKNVKPTPPRGDASK